MKEILIACIKAYQYISRALVAGGADIFRLSGCRQWPTCSDYAIGALRQDGVFRGGARAFFRVLRCNPLSSPSHVH